MKGSRRLFLVCVAAIVTVGIAGCSSEKEPQKAKNYNESKINLAVTSEITDTLTIPDPATTEGTAYIVLHKCDYGTIYNQDRWCVQRKKEQKYDLSFLGLGKKVYVNNFAVGNVTGSGDSLVLVVADKFFKNPDAHDNAYVVVLDYINKKSYVTRADFRAANGRDDQLNLCDITGDGIKEIIFSGQPNVALVWNVFKFDGNNLKEIYSNCKSAKLERDSFKAELLDEYKVKVTGVEFDYEYTFSLLDSGYRKQDLEYIENPDLKYDNWGIRAYADGKVREPEENDKYQYGWYLEYEFLMADNWDKGYAEYDYFKDIKTEEGIHIPISLQLWTEKIGTMNIYLKYSAKTDTLEINKMEFEPEVIEEKESNAEDEIVLEKSNISNNVLEDVYLNKTKFFDTESKRYMYLKKYTSINYMQSNLNGKYEYVKDYATMTQKINRWAETDMDSDGVTELLIELSSSNILLLHNEKNVVYGYAFSYRGMKNIRENGTFEGSGSAADTEIGKIKFSGEDCFYDELCICDELDFDKPIYRINKQNSTKKEVEKFLKNQEKKTKILWNAPELKGE